MMMIYDDNDMPLWQQPFVQIALPIIVSFVLATWYQNSRITDPHESLSKCIDDLRDDMNARFSDVNARFNEVNAGIGGVEKRLERLEERVEALQERSWR
jgi:hypothetical protein